MGIGAQWIVVVTRETRMEGLKQRWGTSSQADFLMEAAVDHETERRARKLSKKGGSVEQEDYDMLLGDVAALTDHDAYKREDAQYQEAVRTLMHDLRDLGFPVREIDRSYLANFDFGRCVLVVVLGQDGLVANTAKYVDDLPVVGVNPDPTIYDGVLLPFEVGQARAVVQRVLKQRHRVDKVTLAEVSTVTGQKMLAFNDFFIGCRSHASARYTLDVNQQREPQSSSGVIVSTGAGLTGWMSSIFNMASGISRYLNQGDLHKVAFHRCDPQLMWAVREPFVSRHSQADNVMGILKQDEELVIASQMPTDGVIFSDGIESDYLEFNSGNIATFGVSKRQAHLVVG